MTTCNACGEENPDSARFCNACGAPFEAPAVAREERKVVTVLFADLVGFTSRAEKMDPEDVRALLAPYHARLREELERFGGTVEKFIGDAVMALFGAPVAHEDDPERAVRAALAIRDWVREQEEELQLRIAVNTGEALIALGARPEAGEGMASGDVVNTTARLQAAAPVNGILVGETTFRATRDVIEYREADPVDAKGKAEPVSAWEAVEARSRFGVDVRQHGAAPLVGRDRELDMLVSTLERVKEERSSQLLTLVGAPGIGKSRLVYELFGAIDRETTLVYWRQGRSLPYGEGVSFWALAEMVKAQAGIREDDTAEEAAGKLSRAVREFVADREVDWVEAHLRPLAGLGAMEAGIGDRRDESFAAWRRFFEAMADRRPLVLVFEDLHWADDGLLDFVDHLVDWARGVPLLVVGTARPELLERRPVWGGGKLNASTVMLSPLREDDTARLVASLLDQSLLLAETQTALLERAGGNPLYAEQFARLYQESGAVDDLPVPESVQGIIAARLDTLPAEEKDLLQDAAVLGKVFWAGALARDPVAVRTALHSLERKDFVRREGRSSVEEDEEYAFRHSLVRDVAYGQIPRAARADKHRRAAEWIAALGRPQDHAEMLAYHYVAAIDYARAAGTEDTGLAEPARRALRDAGDRAYALNAFPAAARFYEQALGLLPVEDTGRPRLLLQLAHAQHFAGDERREVTLEQARAALVAAGDHEGAAEADTVLAELWWHRGRGERVRVHLGRARELVADVPPSPAKARVLSQLSRYRALAEESEEAIELGLEAAAMAEALGLPEIQAHALNNVAIAKGRRGDESVFADLERSIEIALAVNSPEAARGYNNLGAMRWELGDFQGSIGLFNEAVRIGEQLGNASVVRYSRGIQIQQLFPLGEWDEGLRRADEFIAACEAGDRHYLESTLRMERAYVRLARDDVEGALEDIRVALERGREAGDPQALVPVLVGSIFINEKAGRLDEAQKLAEELLPHLELLGARTWQLVDVAWVVDSVSLRETLEKIVEKGAPSMMSWRIDLARAILDEDFETVADFYEGAREVEPEAYARLRMAERLVTEGRRAEADVQLQRALAFYRSVGATRYIREGEALLAASA
jgi:class 3 adenylate cyclase/tetratricopeptide (TPR) repeat protein